METTRQPSSTWSLGLGSISHGGNVMLVEEQGEGSGGSGVVGGGEEEGGNASIVMEKSMEMELVEAENTHHQQITTRSHDVHDPEEPLKVTFKDDVEVQEAPLPLAVETDEENNKKKTIFGLSSSSSREDDEANVIFIDHYTLQVPSSIVRYRGARVIIYENDNHQSVLEDRRQVVDGDGEQQQQHEITVKRVAVTNTGVTILRTTYTLVSLLMLGFLFVLCMQIIMFVFLNLPDHAGATAAHQDVDNIVLIGTICSIPTFLYSMGSLMALGSAFVQDTWSGHTLMITLLGWPSEVIEWLSFIIFLAIPATTICGTLFAGLDDWWAITLRVWSICVFVYFILFALAVIIREVGSCYTLVRLQQEQEKNYSALYMKWTSIMKLCIEITQTERYAATRNEKYIVHGKNEYPKSGYHALPQHKPLKVIQSWYSRFIDFGCPNCAFKIVDPPQLRHSVQDIEGSTPFVTNHSWSLERFFCKAFNSPAVSAFSGPSALRNNQIVSSLVCILVGVLLILLIVCSALVWLDIGLTVVVVLALLAAICCIMPILFSTKSMYRRFQRQSTEKEEEAQGDNGQSNSIEEKQDANDVVMFSVWECLVIKRPRIWYCWFRVALDATLFYLWPMVVLFRTNYMALGFIFLVCGFCSGLRIFFDAAHVLSSVGPMDGISVVESSRRANLFRAVSNVFGRADYTKDERDHIRKSRISQLISKITRSRSVGRWMSIFGVFAIGLAGMLAVALDTKETDPQGGRPAIVQVNDFYYPPEKGIVYPSCEMDRGFTFEADGSPAKLLDFAFLSAISYETTKVAQYHLDDWFGPNVVIDEGEFVERYRNDTNTSNAAVYYKLISVSGNPGTGIIALRGSQTTWDFLHDAQLWLSAGLVQVIRALIPLGWIFTPILADLVTVVSWVEDPQVKEVSYYSFISDFILALKEANYTYQGKSFDNLRITGASLGGGLAIISGAQTQTTAVAISGINAVLSRNTFVPPVSTEDLDTYVFNVIPDRDPIAHIGDRSRQFQQADCKAPLNNPLSCHSMWRSVCEIAYSCGTGNRPVLCRCIETFGYPEPFPRGTATNFTKACRDQEAVLSVELPEGAVPTDPPERL